MPVHRGDEVVGFLQVKTERLFTETAMPARSAFMAGS